MKILLAVDGSAYTKKMLAYLSTHEALVSGAVEYTALTVQAALPPRARAALGKPIVDEYYADEAAKVLNPVSKFLARHGIVPQQISKVAEAGKFDLVVMGSHGHSSLGNLVMGSVSTQVLAHCKVPVLLVR